MGPSTRTATALAAALLVAVLPALAAAQTPVARVVLYEVWETLDLRGVSVDLSNPDPESFRRRFAEAGLLGRQIEATPGTRFATANLLAAEATSNVNIKAGSPGFGLGPIRGDFQLLRYVPLDGNDLENLSDFVVTDEGRLSGTLDLRPALDPAMPLPLAFVSGKWTLQGQGGGHRTFVGIFLIPFRLGPTTFYLIPAAADPAQAALLEGLCPQGGMATLGGVLCPLSPAEHVLGFPLTKAVILLLE